jgi:hypothetical protein
MHSLYFGDVDSYHILLFYTVISLNVYNKSMYSMFYLDVYLARPMNAKTYKNMINTSLLTLSASPRMFYSNHLQL